MELIDHDDSKFSAGQTKLLKFASQSTKNREMDEVPDELDSQNKHAMKKFKSSNISMITKKISQMRKDVAELNLKDDDCSHLDAEIVRMQIS